MIVVLSLIVTAIAAVPALAAPEFELVSLNLTNTTATETGVFSFLPSGAQTDIRLTVSGTATVECLAPKGGILKVFPGSPMTNTGTVTNQSPEPSLIRGWNVGFTVTANTPTAVAKTCPKRWTVFRIYDVNPTMVTTEAIQPSGSNTVVARDEYRIV